ncbi:hypothetical protein DYB28_010866 [Aphanomyces astaci]|uniref:Uncharacterized protein n=1 Tax=Aphanomyces astaci TaxID=112090 RepID=A0A9X8HDS1_APHAT|nr:hypothetical protein DYB28_010866 [Aphanomyces astaci]
MVPGPTLDKEDVDMGQNDGSTKEERRVFMAAYNLYIGQTNAPTANGVRPFTMPVRACIEPATKQRIAEWDMGKDPDDVSEGEWIAWFKQVTTSIPGPGHPEEADQICCCF